MRSFTPFNDLWRMPISVPYSLLVKDEGLAWTCGQVPLDGASKVLAPGDLPSQTDIVCDYIEQILGHSGMQPDAVGKLVLYFVDKTAGDAERMIARCRARFGARPVIIPIAVPYFYFDNLLLEVDAFAGSHTGRFIERANGQAKVKITDGGELVWASLTVDPEHVTDGAALLKSALSEIGVDSDQRLSEHWIAPHSRHDTSSLPSLAQKLERAGLISDAGALVESMDPRAPLVGEITYVKRPAPAVLQSCEVGGVRVIMRQSDRFAWFSARALDGDLGLARQTSQLMSALAETLHSKGMDFTAVVKSTSHYAGGSSADELYENMTIRNSYYGSPGPASTGLPVSGFADRNSRIVVDFVTVGGNR